MPHRTKGSEQELTRIKSVIAGLALAGTISLNAAAKLLETSPRTLQRRLSNRGHVFSELVERSRFKIARALLRETDLKVHEIAARLGYGSPSAFARAFTRWTGQAPNAYRKAQTDRLSEAEQWREMGRSGD